MALVKAEKQAEEGDNDDEDGMEMDTSPKSKEDKSPQVIGSNVPLTVPEEGSNFSDNPMKLGLPVSLFQSSHHFALNVCL